MGEHTAGGSSIPRVLRDQRRWLPWAFEEGRGKRPQLQHSEIDKLLSWNDVKDVELTDTYGIGFSFVGGVQLPDGSYVSSLDLDACVNEDGTLADWAATIVRKCRRTYTTYSPSGTGLRVWLRTPTLVSYIPKLYVKDWNGEGKRPNCQLFGYGVAQYVTETGLLVPGATTKLQLLDDVEWLRELPFFDPVKEHTTNGELTLPQGKGKPPSMKQISTAVLAAPHGDDLINARWADLGYPSASECAWEFARHVLAAAQNHGDAAVEFIIGHTVWGLGHVDALEPQKYMTERRWAKDLCRAVFKGVAEKKPAAAEFKPVETQAKTKTKKLNIEPLVVTMSDIKPRKIHWLWQDRIALGRLSLLSAPPGAGKSYLTCHMAACVTNGEPWPDGAPCEEGQVLFVTCEDDPHDTVRPRLDACEASVFDVHMLAGVQRIDPRTQTQSQVAFTLEDLRPLDVALQRYPKVRLVVIDPVGSYFGGKHDSYKDTETRAVLAPLADVARKHNVAVLLVAHTRKAGAGSADDSVLGSRAFTGLARSVYHIFRDPDKRHRRFLLPGKNNLGAELPGLAFELKGKPQPKVVFDEKPVEISADELAAKLIGTRKRQKNLPGATETWLREVLTERGRPAAEIFTLAEKAGLAKRTVQRAADQLGVVPQKRGFQGGWWWELPSLEARPAMQGPLEVADPHVEEELEESEEESPPPTTPESLRDLL